MHNHPALEVPAKILSLFSPEEHAGIKAHWETFLMQAPATLSETPSPFVLDAFIQYLAEHAHFDLTQIEALHFSEPVEMLGTLSQHEQRGSGSAGPQSDENYQFEKELGKGAMGVVYEALDRTLGRHVAYKALLSQEHLPPLVIQRFIHEVQITAQLDHPYIIPVYRLAYPEEGLPTYTMKKVEGLTLKDILAQTRQALDQHIMPEYSREHLLTLFLKVCDAMGFAHARQVIHRDLKPANIMVGSYEDVYVMDWGIARRFGVSEAQRSLGTADLLQADLTQAGQILGTPRYMSPQQAAARNQHLDGRSDLFALGLILFEICTLKPAIQADSQIGLLKQILQAKLAPFTPYQSHKIAQQAGFASLEAPLQAIIEKACARKEADRYATMSAFSQDLRLFMAGEPVSVYTQKGWEKAIFVLQKHQRATFACVAGLILSLVLILVASVSYQLWHLQESRKEDAARAELLSAGANHAQRLEREFIQIQNHLQTLGTRAREALLWGKPQTQAHWYFNAQYDQGLVPGFNFNPRYQRKISYRYPVVKLAPGLQAEAVKNTLQRFFVLNPVFERIFKETPILVWGYVSLENGLHYSYPGKGGYQAEYDPRQRPWYKEANAHKTPFWGTPYEDISGLGLVIPTIMPLYDTTSDPATHLGHAGIEMVLDSLIPEYLQLPQQAVKKVGLVYRNQTLLLAADNLNGQRLDTFDLPEELFKQFPKRRSGSLTQDNIVWNFYYLEVLDAYYVVQMNYQDLRKVRAKSQPPQE